MTNYISRECNRALSTLLAQAGPDIDTRPFASHGTSDTLCAMDISACHWKVGRRIAFCRRASYFAELDISLPIQGSAFGVIRNGLDFKYYYKGASVVISIN